MRHSLRTEEANQRKAWPRDAFPSGNLEFFAAARKQLPRKHSFLGAIGLVGGSSLVSSTLENAQAVLRWDHRPSHWSHCFLLSKEAEKIENTRLWECSLEPDSLGDLRPERNAVVVRKLDAYADAQRFPNVGLISFQLTSKDVEALLERAREPNVDRLRFPLWDLAGRWISYVWGGGAVANPLSEGLRMPAAGYVEMAYEAAGIDLTPGASERNSSPEHLWQTAKWWTAPFEDLGKPLFLQFCIREDVPQVSRAVKPRLER